MAFIALTHYDSSVTTRGYNAQNSFHSIESWQDAVDLNALKTKNAAWSILVDENTGDVVGTYKRAAQLA